MDPETRREIEALKRRILTLEQKEDADAPVRKRWLGEFQEKLDNAGTNAQRALEQWADRHFKDIGGIKAELEEARKERIARHAIETREREQDEREKIEKAARWEKFVKVGLPILTPFLLALTSLITATVMSHCK